MPDPLVITPSLSIPPDELQFRFVRSGGPGGQHVNKTATQVELTFDVAHSPSLDDGQRERIGQVLRKRIDGDGLLHLVSTATRSQTANREEVTQRFRVLLAAALKPVKPRRPTRPGRAAKEKRIASKKARGDVKKRRSISPRELE
jgi:ribosome-associated protein